jgi:hypothetical protein
MIMPKAAATFEPERFGLREEFVTGLLIRIGIDGTPQYVGWKAPVDMETRRFIFVPIKDAPYNNDDYIEGGRRIYGEEVLPELRNFAIDCGSPKNPCFSLPTRLQQQPMHLDPDFLQSTYGDDAIRGRKLEKIWEE